MWDFFAIAGIIFFILIAIIIISLAFKDNKKDVEDFKKKIIDDYLAEQKNNQKTSFSSEIFDLIKEINNLNPLSAINKIDELDQKTIDLLFPESDRIKNYVIRRALIKKYRFEILDKDFWIEEINKRETKKVSSRASILKNEIEIEKKYEIPENVQFLGEDFISQSEIAELQSRKIDKKYFRPKKDTDPEHPYYLKKFVITGTFNYFPDRNDLAELLYNVGADIDTSISKNIHYVVVGENPGWRKMELIEEYGITILSEDDIIKFFQLEK